MTESVKTPLRDQLPREGAFADMTTTKNSLDAPGADRARRGAIQTFCAWAIGPLAGAAAAMASDEATVTELAERLELYEARAREAERVALAKDAELEQKLAELSQLSDGDAPNAPISTPSDSAMDSALDQLLGESAVMRPDASTCARGTLGRASSWSRFQSSPCCDSRRLRSSGEVSALFSRPVVMK